MLNFEEFSSFLNILTTHQLINTHSTQKQSLCNQSFGGVFYVVTMLLGFFCGCRGFCHRTESDLFLFSQKLRYIASRAIVVADLCQFVFCEMHIHIAIIFVFSPSSFWREITKITIIFVVSPSMQNNEITTKMKAVIRDAKYFASLFSALRPAYDHLFVEK